MKNLTVLEVDYSHGLIWARDYNDNEYNVIWSGFIDLDMGDKIKVEPLTGSEEKSFYDADYRLIK